MSKLTASSETPSGEGRTSNGLKSRLYTVTTYRDFESREHLTAFVEDQVEASLRKFLMRHNTRVTVTLNHERSTTAKLFQVGISLKPAHKAPIHIVKESDDLHVAVRNAVKTVEKILRREHARFLQKRRHSPVPAA